MTLAYVDGRPTPSSSMALTSDASVYRAGGCVVCEPGSKVTGSTASPSTSGGRTTSRSASSASGSSSPST